MKLASGTAPVAGAAPGRHRRRPRHRRRGEQQRSRHVRGDAPGGVSAQAADDRPARAAGARPRSRWRRSRAPRALGMDEEIGSLEPGKRADLIVVSMTRGAADADVRSVLASGLRDAGRRRADDDCERTGADARPEGADAERSGGARRGARARRPGCRAAVGEMNVLLDASRFSARMRELAAEIERDYPPARTSISSAC